MATKVIYPGSFDPITLGHVDVIKRIAKIFPDVTLVIAQSDQKQYWFSAPERLELVQSTIRDFKNVKAVIYDGLIVDYARQIGAQVIVRGLRAVSDFENETAMAHINRKMYPDIETLIVLASPELTFYASRLVKEVARFNGDLSPFVPDHVQKAVQKKLKKSGGRDVVSKS